MCPSYSDYACNIYCSLDICNSINLKLNFLTKLPIHPQKILTVNRFQGHRVAEANPATGSRRDIHPTGHQSVARPHAHMHT